MIGSGILYILLFVYVGLLLLVTRSVTTHPAYQRGQQHPTVIIVALGIYANATGLAIQFRSGLQIRFRLSGFYLGTTGMFLLAPVMLFTPVQNRQSASTLLSPRSSGFSVSKPNGRYTFRTCLACRRHYCARRAS